jgi:uncharacterized protein
MAVASLADAAACGSALSSRGAAGRLKSYNLADIGRLPQCTTPTTRPRKTSLKLHQDSSGALNTVTGYGADYVEINLQRHSGSIIVLPEGPVIPWPVSSFDALSAEHFAQLIEPAPEVVIFGSGERLRFPHPRLTAALAKHRIGVETMDFKAACRTYNILMAEGRKVAAALLIEGGAQG